MADSRDERGIDVAVLVVWQLARLGIGHGFLKYATVRRHAMQVTLDLSVVVRALARPQAARLDRWL